MMDKEEAWELMLSMRYILNQCIKIGTRTTEAYMALVEIQNEAWVVLDALWQEYDHAEVVLDALWQEYDHAEEVPLDSRT